MWTGRFWLHFLLGLVIAPLYHAHWVLVAGAVYWFVKYEFNEDRWVKDQAWKDMGGALAGLIVGGYVSYIL